MSFAIALILGNVTIFQSKKIKARLLTIMGVNILLASFFWLVISLDFVNILINEINLVEGSNYYFYGILSWCWAPLVPTLSMMICGELILPKKKKAISLTYFILSVLFTLFLVLDPKNVIYVEFPSVTGESLVTLSLNDFSISGILLYVFMLSGIIFCGFGYLYKSLNSEGVIKKKFMLLSTGYLIFSLFPLIGSLLDIFMGSSNYFISRFGMVTGIFLFYFGLKEEPEKKIRPKKDIDVKESLFRIIKTPETPEIDESDWKESIQYLYVVQKSGILAFSQELGYIKESEKKMHEDLLASALSGISSLVKEIVNNPSPLKVIKQEGFNILVEEGEDVFIVVFSVKDYKIIRDKMKSFLEDFQDFFEEVIDSNETTVFLPAKKLVKKHFY
ncbi:MAG: hypothetical protein ACFFCS_12780 [Candidatus Hodarchaeota archaeon]